MAHGEVANGQGEPHQKTAATLAEGSILLPTAQTARVDPAGVVKSVRDRVIHNSATHVPVSSVPVRLAVSSGDCSSCGAVRMPSKLASAELDKSPESYEQSEQWCHTLERMHLSPEACSFILGAWSMDAMELLGPHPSSDS